MKTGSAEPTEKRDAEKGSRQTRSIIKDLCLCLSQNVNLDAATNQQRDCQWCSSHDDAQNIISTRNSVSGSRKGKSVKPRK